MYTINQGHIMYGSWDISAKDKVLCHFGSFFLPFDPPNNPKNQNFEKENAWRFYHFTLVYHKWQSWCMVLDISGRIYHDRQYFCHLWPFFDIYPLTAQKMKISEKWKKHLEVSSFYTSVSKIMIISYTVPEICLA